MHDFILVCAWNGCAHPRFNGSGLGLPMTDFLLALVHVGQSPCAAWADLFDRRPAMCAGIWTARINRTAETSADECFWLVSVFHC